MEQKFIMIDCKGILNFIPVDDSDATDKANKFKKEFGGVAAKDSKGNLKMFSGDDILAVKGQKPDKTDNIEKLNEILK